MPRGHPAGRHRGGGSTDRPGSGCGARYQERRTPPPHRSAGSRRYEAGFGCGGRCGCRRGRGCRAGRRCGGWRRSCGTDGTDVGGTRGSSVPSAWTGRRSRARRVEGRGRRRAPRTSPPEGGDVRGRASAARTPFADATRGSDSDHTSRLLRSATGDGSPDSNRPGANSDRIESHQHHTAQLISYGRSWHRTRTCRRSTRLEAGRPRQVDRAAASRRRNQLTGSARRLSSRRGR